MIVMHESHTDHVAITLPYPPSVNHYWRSRVCGRKRGGSFVRTFLGDRAAAYRREVAKIIIEAGLQQCEGALRLDIVLHPPDFRRRDIDNPLKGLIDALKQRALSRGVLYRGLFEDDSQIRELSVRFAEPIKGGYVHVRVSPLNEELTTDLAEGVRR